VVWSNYGTILTSAAFWEFLGNSALIATIATALAVGLGSMVAFALSQYVFRGREVVFTLFISAVPAPDSRAAAVPAAQLMGLLDNQFGVALPRAAFSLPITILILRPFMRGIPGDLEDAAM
jgi:raffinose/stachyose/melibiose transport system permease protein